nr:hypothetical protein KitaXyl93_20380 [Kitasatospora sp. Xyl93]
MTDIAVREAQPVATVVEPPAESVLMAWAREAQQAERIATNLANTSFVPASLRGKPAEITAAILAGIELGLQPMATLRSMDVIQGTPALRAHAMRGLVQSHGHEVELVESTPQICRMRGRRLGADGWQEVTWTIERAQQLGLTGKDQWKKQPGTMLIARATGEICRLIASDVLYAMPYASEELRSDVAEAVVQSARVTLAEITGATPAAAQAEPSDPWADVEYDAPVEEPHLPAWPQVGGAE